MSVATPRSSPWDVAVPARRSHRGLLAPLAWLLGIAGVVAQVQGYGPTQQRCAAYLAAAAALLVGALAVRAGLLLRALVALVAVGVAVVLARPSLGLTVVGLGLASTALATAAVVGVPIARRSTRMVGPAALAVPFLAFAGLSWYRTASLPRAAVGLVLAAAVDGPVAHIRISQGFPTPRGVVTGRIDTDVWGPGVAATWFTGLIDTLLLGCATPTSDGGCELRYSFVVRATGDADATSKLAQGFIEEIHQRTVEDVEMWEMKAYVPKPVLAHGDGPIMQYRRWCEQFYAEGVDPRREPWVPGEPELEGAIVEV